MSGHTVLIVFAVALFVLGVALLVIAIRGEIKLRRRTLLPANNKQPEVNPETTPAAGIAPSHVRASTTQLSRPISGKPLPELRPNVIAVSYKRLQQLPALGLETQNIGKEAALEISIPDIKLGTSIVQFEGNYQRITVNESAHWRVLIKHDTGGFSTGNELPNEMRRQGKGEIVVPIHYKSANELYYVTFARLELKATAESGIAVHNDTQQLIKWPTASVQPAEAALSSTAPRPYLEVEDPMGEAFGKTLFHFTNRGGDVAHNVQVQPLSINHLTVVFDPIQIIPVNEARTVTPNIPGRGIMQNHDILNLMVNEWDKAFSEGGLLSKSETDEWVAPITVTYTDFNEKPFEATMDLVVFPIRRTLAKKHASEWPKRERKTVEVRNIKFRPVQ